MANKTPLKAIFTGLELTALGEFETGDTTPVENGGTGATTAADARTNLGLGDVATLDVGTTAGTAAAGDHLHAGIYEPADTSILKDADIGVSVQAHSANLDEFAAVNPTTAGMALLDDADAAAQRTTLGLVIGTDVQPYDADIPTTAASQAEMEAGSEAALRSMSPLRIKQAIDALTLPGGVYGLFRKADPTIVAFTKTGNFTVSTATTLYVEVNGVLKTIASSVAVTMPGSATAGTDYAIWAKTDGTLEATSNHTSPPTANARRIGGFHYAPGGNATAQAGGDTTPSINAYSLWDLKFRPACPDPRGMTLVAGGFWCDIYLTGVDAITNGTSKYNVTHADGSSPPKVPALFGGNGSTTYGSLTWFEAQELASAFGKRTLYQQEFMAAAYGTTEASSVGTDQASSILNAAYTSKWGVIQASGVLWVWGQDRGGAYSSAGWNANTEGRGSEYNAPNAALFGGFWLDGADSGSRSSYWASAASHSNSVIGLRCACDHLLLD